MLLPGWKDLNEIDKKRNSKSQRKLASNYTKKLMFKEKGQTI